MFFDTKFLNNNEIQLILEKTADGDEKSGFLYTIFLSATSMTIGWVSAN